MIHASSLGKGSDDEYVKAFAFLSECLFKYHGEKAIILIDEYDVPLENAYFEGFYDEMIDFIRSLFESALKTNPYLEKSVITGYLRISKESIFTGLNNLKVDSVLHTEYGDSFGFTESEVEEMLAYYDLQTELPEVKQWYDGYQPILKYAICFFKKGCMVRKASGTMSEMMKKKSLPVKIT